MRSTHKVLFGAAAVALFSLNPLESEASLRYRTDGIGCVPYDQEIVRPNAASGLELLGNGGNRGVVCNIPLGPDLVDLGDGDHPLASARIRFYQPTSGFLATSLVVHDFDSADVCGCGSTTFSASTGYFQRASGFDCGSCAYNTSWAADINIFHQDPGLTIKLISLYD